ncbi:MAG: hypothetical protein CV087_05560 [Candidatus Brocadia sp. WS118]|nr:MAG: hypothetical protein CV087_05560 [Candidatus Brocadia sp. WS118]
MKTKEQATKLTKERVRQLLDKVVSVYTKNFADGMEGRDYLEKRGINDAGVWGQYNLGFSNGRLNEILPRKGALIDELKHVGILKENGSEYFANCVIVPVYDLDGNISTLYGLGADEGVRVLLSASFNGLWNIGIIKTYPKIVLVTSIIDGLSIAMAGFCNVVAVFGGHVFSEDNFRLMKDYGVQHIISISNGRTSDEKGAQVNKEEFAEKMSEYSISREFRELPQHHSLNSYMMEHGVDKLAMFIEGSNEATKESASPTPVDQEDSPVREFKDSFLICYGLRKYQVMGLDKGARKLRATVRIEHAGKLHVDTLDFYSAKARKALVQDICRVFAQTPEVIESDITRLMIDCEKRQQTEQKIESCVTNVMSSKEVDEAESFGKRTDLIQQIIKDFEVCGLVGEEPNKLLGYLVMTSRKRDAPLSLLFMSSSGAGKTAVQDAVCAFCPEEDLQKLTTLSGKALFYKDTLSLKHKVLALEEGDGVVQATYAIRNLISAGELISESTIKDLTTGKLTTMENKVEGPTAVFLTTTNPQIDPETKSRFFVTSIDESKEQTKRILLSQRQKHLSDAPAQRIQSDSTIKRHRNFQRLLRNVAVKNPFADKLTYGDDRLQSRRDQPKYLNLIKTVAFLRQMVKPLRYEEKNGTALPYIDVDIEDIKITNTLAHEVLGRSLDELSRPTRDLLILLDEMLEVMILDRRDDTLNRTTITFSRWDIRHFTGWSNTRLHIHLKELVEFEYLVVKSGRNGLPYRYRLAYEGQGKNGEKFMLGLKDIKELEV